MLESLRGRIVWKKILEIISLFLSGFGLMCGDAYVKNGAG